MDDDTETTVTTVTQTIYRRAPEDASVPVPVPIDDDSDSPFRLIDVVCDAAGRICGHICQRYRDGAYFLVPQDGAARRAVDDPPHRYYRNGYLMRVVQFAGPPRFWHLRVATYGHQATALIVAPTEEAARALFTALDGCDPDEVREQPDLLGGALAYEHRDWDDRDD